MPKSLIIKANCPVCGKIAVEKARINFASASLISLECGHMIPSAKLQATDYNSIVSEDGRSLFPYQIEGVKFVEESGANCLIADDMGLGKTVQAAAVLKLHQESLCPSVICTMTTAKVQWFYELVRFTRNKKVQIISSGKEIAMPGMDFYVTTYDLIKVKHLFSLINIKTLVLDECQAIKNHRSGRAKAVQTLKTSHQIEHVIGLSGTPIKNNAAEYFTILNLLRPTQFPEYFGFIRRWCDSYEGMYGPKVGGLKNPELFRDMTKDFIIRRTKAEVLPDLPPKSRNFFHCGMESKFGAAYRAAFKELEEVYYQDDTPESGAMKLAIMNKMRQIVGQAKVQNCIDFVTEHLISNDRPIVIFTHHDNVRLELRMELNKWCAEGGFPPVLMLTSDLSGDRRADVIKQFQEGKSRVLIASTLAAGIAINLQFCNDAVMLERQWNPPNEEQAEDRFHRFGQLNPVTITYMIAAETIDQYFTELVEQKRAIFASTMNNTSIDWDEKSLLKELMDLVMAKGLKNFVL